MADTVQFNYIKSNFFRVAHITGALGGLGPSGQIEVNLYSERRPIPRVTVHSVSREKGLGPEDMEARVVREGFVREVELAAIMDVETARAIRDWLSQRIEEYEKLQAHIRENV